MNQLFVYGTLRPNYENAHLLERIGGTWQKGYVHGVVHILDWGPDKGLFAIVLDPQAAAVEGYFFSSEKLTEGIQYQRVRVQGTLESGERVDAWTYEMKEA